MPTSTPPLDLQLNGYRGVDFNADTLTAEQMHASALALKRDGCGQCLATIITDSLEAMVRRIGNLSRAIETDPVVRTTFLGIHVEGPFINPERGYHGAHPQQHARKASQDEMQWLIEAGRGHIRLVTLAPEMDPGLEVTRRLAAAGIAVSAGHCNPDLDTLYRAVDAGLRLFTHLGNGCPATLPRHDNIIQRVLSLRTLPYVMFIADGVHVPTFALGNYVRTVGLDRVIFVTDGTSAAGMGPGRYQLGGVEVLVDPSGAAWSPDKSHLVGSTITMPEAQRYLAESLGLNEGEITQTTVLNPLQALGRSN